MLLEFRIMKLVRLITVCLLTLALPLQGIAAYAPAPSCGDGAAAAQAHEQRGAHHDGMAADQDQRQQAAENHAGGHGHADMDGNSGHSCCHHVFTGAAAALIAATPEAPEVVMPRVSLLNTLFIPELPQRPPRA